MSLFSTLPVKKAYSLCILMLLLHSLLFGQEKDKLLLSLNPSLTKQEISIVGGDMERSQGALQGAKNKEEIVKWCFGDIAFNVCRVSYDKKQEMQEGKKNFKFYDNAIKSMQMIKAINPNIAFWATMKSDYNGYENSNNLPEWICDSHPTTRFDCKKYAIFLADYLELMQKNGVRIEYLSTAKEWTQAVSAKRAKEIILYLNEECANRKITQPKYIDAATWSMAQGVSWLKSVAKLSMQKLYWGCATHNYNSEGLAEYEKFVELADKLKLPAFAEESGGGVEGRTSGKEPENLDRILRVYSEKCEFYKDGMAGEVIFEPFSRGINSETRAIYFPQKGTGYRMRAYYIMKRFANSLAGGKCYVSHRITGRNAKDISAMAFVDKKTLFVCIINNGENAYKDFQLSLEGNLRLKNQVSLHSFDISMGIEGEESTLSIAKKKLNLGISAKSIHFISISLN